MSSGYISGWYIFWTLSDHNHHLQYIFRAQTMNWTRSLKFKKKLWSRDSHKLTITTATKWELREMANTYEKNYSTATSLNVEKTPNFHACKIACAFTDNKWARLLSNCQFSYQNSYVKICMAHCPGSVIYLKHHSWIKGFLCSNQPFPATLFLASFTLCVFKQYVWRYFEQEKYKEEF